MFRKMLNRWAIDRVAGLRLDEMPATEWYSNGLARSLRCRYKVGIPLTPVFVKKGRRKYVLYYFQDYDGRFYRFNLGRSRYDDQNWGVPVVDHRPGTRRAEISPVLPEFGGLIYVNQEKRPQALGPQPSSAKE